MAKGVVDERQRDGAGWAIRLTWVGMVAVVVVLATIGFGREVFNYNTETDYVSGFVEEAQRFLRGEPMRIDFHPPAYPITIALGYALLRDWFTVGVLVSLAAALASLAFAFALLRRLFGVAAGVGGVVALAISPTFLGFSMQATSDVFALALYLGAVLAAYLSAERRSVGHHLLAGVVIGVALLARSNHIVLVGLLLLHLVHPRSGVPRLTTSGRLRELGVVLLGVGLPVALWLGFAASTGAPFLPTKTHENFALTYFAGDDRVSGDARLEASAQFTSTLQVLAADPARIARTYLVDLARTTYRLASRNTVLPFPWIALGLVAAVAILIVERERRAVVAVLLLNLAAMYLLLNFKYYEDRYYLFLVPFVGGLVGHGARLAFGATDRVAWRVGGAVVLALAVAFGAIQGSTRALRLHAANLAHDASAAARYLVAVGVADGSAIYARKDHAAYYAGLEGRWIPPAADLEELAQLLGDAADATPGQVFLFYGRPERSTRPQFARLTGPGRAEVPGLRWVAAGDENDGWVLFEVDPGGDPSAREPVGSGE